MLVLTFALACASVAAALSAQRVWDYVRAAWMLRRFPGPAPVSLVSGHVPLLNDAKRPPHAVVKELSEQYRGIFRLRLFWRQVGLGKQLPMLASSLLCLVILGGSRVPTLSS